MHDYSRTLHVWPCTYNRSSSTEDTSRSQLTPINEIRKCAELASGPALKTRARVTSEHEHSLFPASDSEEDGNKRTQHFYSIDSSEHVYPSLQQPASQVAPHSVLLVQPTHRDLCMQKSPCSLMIMYFRSGAGQGH